MSINIKLSELSDENREKINSELQIKLENNKFNKFAPPKYIYPYEIDSNDNVIVPFSYGCRKLKIKRPKRNKFSEINVESSFKPREEQNELIKESLNTLTSAIKAIDNSSKIIEKTLTEKNSQINNSIDNIESISNNLANVSNDLNDFGLTNVLSDLEMSINGINSMVNNLNSDNSTLGNLISNDDVYDNLNSSIENLNLLIRDIKTNPKKYIHFSIFGRK